MGFTQTFVLVSPLLATVISSPVSAASRHHNPGAGNSRTVFQFANGTWVENIAVRANGNLLVTLVDRPELYEINPFNATHPKLVHRFEGYMNLFGIAEATPDVFAVAAGNFSLERGNSDPESYAVWKVDLTARHGAEISKITNVPDAASLNGMTTLDSEAGTVLLSDSAKGEVIRLDTHTGDYAVVHDDETMKAPADASLPIGINGVRKFGNYLHYVNIFNPLYARVLIDPVSGEAMGPYQVISTGIATDDFALDCNGTAYLAGIQSNTVFRAGLDGNTEPFAGNLNSSLVAGVTSAAFGRTSKDRNILYVTTNGSRGSPVNGTYTEGGKVVALSV